MRRKVFLSLLALRSSSSPSISSPCSHSLLLFSRFLSRRHLYSPEDDAYDPPFTPRSNSSPEKRKTNPKRQQRPLPSSSSSEKSLPVHSDLPFDFRYSYSEINPAIKPIGFREPPNFSPFGPGKLDRKWDGVSAKVEDVERVDWEKLIDERRKVIGEPLTEEEVQDLVEKYRHNDCSRQINLGKGGVTHNLIDDIHNHWKRTEAVRIKCLGVPTLDMDNVCFHLEDKTGGVIIYRNINILLLYRGRNYVPIQRPVIPVMLWKPRAAIYPRLVKNVADGLTFQETKEMRNKGIHAPALMKLTRNGVYVNVIERLRTAFETEEVVRLDCKSMDKSDCKKIGVKLRDLVPCVPLLFKDSQIILWKGKKDNEYSDQQSQIHPNSSLIES